MKVLVLIIGFMGIFSTVTTNLQEWNEYKHKYHKSYLGIDDFYHRLNYLSNKNRILAHNRRTDIKYKLGIGQFTDLNTIQFNQILGGLILSPPPRPIYPTTTPMPTTIPTSSGPTFAPPIYRNWTSDGGVSEVKDQGTNCNAAWAFAALAALEGHHYFAFDNLLSLSVQNIIDCSGARKSCSGEQTPHTAYDFIMNNQNVNKESAYLYTGFPGSCKYNANNVGTTLGSYESISENDDRTLFDVVAFRGPVVVGFNPFSFEFQHYKSGIFEHPRISFGSTNRYYMTVTGYGWDKATNLDYWILKNSMGINWGELGYIRVIRNSKNPITKSAIYPNV